jgi:hypothetical protein
MQLLEHRFQNGGQGGKKPPVITPHGAAFAASFSGKAGNPASGPGDVDGRITDVARNVVVQNQISDFRFQISDLQR